MNILFVTSTRIGDAILSTGLLEYLRAENAEINDVLIIFFMVPSARLELALPKGQGF